MTGKTATEMLAQYSAKNHGHHRQEHAEELKMRKLFAARSAHLPGNNWCQDWTQWMLNNHPLLGLCCRHRLNPVGCGPRSVIILSSVSFGLIATNLIYLFYRTNPQANETLVRTEFEGGAFEITYETIMLWTLGGLLHSLADLGMWHLTACACCINSCVAKLGPYVAIAITACLCAISTLAVLWRATYDDEIMDNADANDLSEKGSDWMPVNNLESFQFLTSYFMELLIVYFFYYPIMATVFFSGGVWGCIPCVGGRPKEIQRQKDEQARNQLKEQSNNDKFVDIA